MSEVPLYGVTCCLSFASQLLFLTRWQDQDNLDIAVLDSFFSDLAELLRNRKQETLHPNPQPSTFHLRSYTPNPTH